MKEELFNVAHVIMYGFSKKKKMKNQKLKIKIKNDLIKKYCSKSKKKIKNLLEKEKIYEKKGSEIVKYKPKSNFTFGKFLSYIYSNNNFFYCS